MNHLKYRFFLFILLFITKLIYADTYFKLLLVNVKSIQRVVEKTIDQYYRDHFPHNIASSVDKAQIIKLDSDQYHYLLAVVEVSDLDDLYSAHKVSSGTTGGYLHVLTADYKPVTRYLIKEDTRVDDPNDDLTAGDFWDIGSLFQCKTATNNGIGIIYTIRVTLEDFRNFGVFFDVLPDGSLKKNQALTNKMSTSTEVADDTQAARKTLGCLRDKESNDKKTHPLNPKHSSKTYMIKN